MLDKALNNVAVEDIEMLYNYDVENIPVIVKALRERGLDRDNIRNVFEIQDEKGIRDKDQLKLSYYEFIESCIKGNLN